MPSRPIPQTDKEFEARFDADALIAARKIESDPPRFNAAVKQAGLIADDEMRRAKAAVAVSKMKAKATATSRSRKRA